MMSYGVEQSINIDQTDLEFKHIREPIMEYTDGTHARPQ
jgi:hypothetical protein